MKTDDPDLLEIDRAAEHDNPVIRVLILLTIRGRPDGQRTEIESLCHR